ncbi:MAG: hypothetical protein AAF556_06340 [Pseudomonadota bacterium]
MTQEEWISGQNLRPFGDQSPCVYRARLSSQNSYLTPQQHINTPKSPICAPRASIDRVTQLLKIRDSIWDQRRYDGKPVDEKRHDPAGPKQQPLNELAAKEIRED